MDLDKKLVILCQFGYFKELEKYLRTEEGKSEFRSLRHFPLVICCVQGSRRYKGRLGSDHAATCVILVQNGAEVNLTDSDLRTALHWAVRLKQPSLVGKLIELGSTPTLEDCDGLNACHLSVKLGREECLTALAQSYACKKLLEKCDGNGTPPVILAVKTGNVNITHLLLEQGIAVNVADRRARRTALHYAYIAKHKQLFNLLIEHGARADLIDHKDQQVIHRVCATSDPEYLSIILEKCPRNLTPVNSLTAERYTPLMTACMNGRAKQVALLLNQPTVSVSTKDKAGRTALHYCSGTEDTSCARLVCQVCDAATLNMKCENGFSVLNLAIIAGNVALAAMLIQHGLDVRNVDCEQHSLLHWATVCGKPEMMELMLKHCQGDLNTPDSHHAFPLHYAAQMSANNSVIEKLLEHGADVHCADDEDRMAIQWAASAGNSASCLYLVRYGADVNVQDKHGLSALHCAASQGHGDCVRSLVEHCGATIDIKDKDGCTPVFYATNNGHAEAVSILLELGAGTGIHDDRGRGLDHCAAVSGSLPLVGLLRHYAINMWTPSLKGDYPIHDAAYHSHTDIVRELLEQRPDYVDIANHANRTCLHIAALTNNQALCMLLLNKGAVINVFMTNKEEKVTPYDVAILRGHSDLALYLYTQGGLSAHTLRSKQRPHHVHFPKQLVHKSSTFPTLPQVKVSDHSGSGNTGTTTSKPHHSNIHLPSCNNSAENVRKHALNVSRALPKPGQPTRTITKAVSQQTGKVSTTADTSSELLGIQGNYNYFHENTAVEGDGEFAYLKRNYSSEFLNTTNDSLDNVSVNSSSCVNQTKTASTAKPEPCSTVDSRKPENICVNNNNVNEINLGNSPVTDAGITQRTIHFPPVAKTSTSPGTKIIHSNSLPDNITSNSRQNYQAHISHHRERANSDMGFLLSKPPKPKKIFANTQVESNGEESADAVDTNDNSVGSNRNSQPSSTKSTLDRSKLSRNDEYLNRFSYLKKPGYYYGATVPVRPKHHRKGPTVSEKIISNVRSSVKDFEQQRRAVPHLRQLKRGRVHARSWDGLATATTCRSHDQSADKTFDSLTVTDELLLKPLSQWEEYVEQITSQDPEHAKGNLEFLRSLLKEREEKVKSDLMTAKSVTEAKCRQMSAVIKQRKEMDEREKETSETDMQRLIERTEMLFDRVNTHTNQVTHSLPPSHSHPGTNTHDGRGSKTAPSQPGESTWPPQQRKHNHVNAMTQDVFCKDDMKHLLHAYRPTLPTDLSNLKGRSKPCGKLEKTGRGSSNNSINKLSHAPHNKSHQRHSVNGDQKYEYIMTKHGMTRVRSIDND